MSVWEWFFALLIYAGVGFMYRMVTADSADNADIEFDEFDGSAAGIALILTWPFALLRRTASSVGRNSPKVAQWIVLMVRCSIAFALDPEDK